MAGNFANADQSTAGPHPGADAVVDAAEAQALPALRDLLLATAGDAARGLLIDLASGAAQRTTRLDQAIETLQGALFAVRVGAGAAVLTQVLDVLSRT